MKRSPLALSLLLIALGALALWGSTRLAWIDAVVAAGLADAVTAAGVLAVVEAGGCAWFMMRVTVTA